jgi:hypothetical protein
VMVAVVVVLGSVSGSFISGASSGSRSSGFVCYSESLMSAVKEVASYSSRSK